MQELFVPYTESLQLKELGFNEKCFGGYLKNSKELWIGYVSSQGGEQFNRDYYILTPLYEQAFKFFRDNYKLFCYIEPVIVEGANSPIKFDFVILEEYSDDIEYNNLPFHKHEEAELECLRKLIEIVNDK